MFTGIVEAKGRVRRAHVSDEGAELSLSAPRTWRLRKGQSVAVDGICLTVISCAPGSFRVFAIPETLSKTTVSLWHNGRVVNVERALKAHHRLDGHLLQGHIGGTARVRAVVDRGASTLITLSLPSSLMRGVVLHGAIALNGVSLTVAKKTATSVTVALIPYTKRMTTLGALVAGDRVNVETDFLGRRGRVGRNDAGRAWKATRRA